MVKHVLLGNYGNEHIALLQWAFERQLPDVISVSVDTHWAAVGWQRRVDHSQQWVESLGFTSKRLQARAGFADLVRQQQRFPSVKFQWCAGLLKGLALNDYLDQVDPTAQTLVLLAKRRARSRLASDLTEFTHGSEHHGGRTVWCPLFETRDDERDVLIRRAGFNVLPHRSLECDPCIHNTQADFRRLQVEDCAKTQALECNINQAMFNPETHGNVQGINAVQQWSKTCDNTKQSSYNENLTKSCGSPWACGD